jgi:hypothetical protein
MHVAIGFQNVIGPTWMLAEWQSADSFTRRQNALAASVGTYDVDKLVLGGIVFDDGVVDSLKGGGRDWFFKGRQRPVGQSRLGEGKRQPAQLLRRPLPGPAPP